LHHDCGSTTTEWSAEDPDGDSLTYSIVANGTKGTGTITNPATGAFAYTPIPNANGIDTFTFKVNDGVHDSNVATETVQIAPVNDAPVAMPAPRLRTLADPFRAR
jgi:Big-like domain-containing protein